MLCFRRRNEAGYGPQDRGLSLPSTLVVQVRVEAVTEIHATVRWDSRSMRTGRTISLR
jgi:hypothetical protein